MNDKIQEKLKEVQARFDTLNKEAQELQEQINEGNRLLAVKREELVRLQGEFRALNSLDGKTPQVIGEVVEKPKAAKKSEDK